MWGSLTLVPIILKEESDIHRSECESLFMFSNKNTSELLFMSKKNKATYIRLKLYRKQVYQTATRNIKLLTEEAQ